MFTISYDKLRTRAEDFPGAVASTPSGIPAFIATVEVCETWVDVFLTNEAVIRVSGPQDPTPSGIEALKLVSY